MLPVGESGQVGPLCPLTSTRKGRQITKPWHLSERAQILAPLSNATSWEIHLTPQVSWYLYPHTDHRAHFRCCKATCHALSEDQSVKTAEESERGGAGSGRGSCFTQRGLGRKAIHTGTRHGPEQRAGVSHEAFFGKSDLGTGKMLQVRVTYSVENLEIR